VPEDFQEIYAEHLEPVWRYVRARVPGQADAEDLTSESFVRALGAWRGYDPRRGSVRAWLLGIARHVVADWWRRQAAERRAEQVSDAAIPGWAEPEVEALGALAMDEVRGHLAKLTERERDAVALRFGAGLKAAEVGAALGVSETAARMLVHRAVSRLRSVVAHE
jgi:RNA polymerase sigma factor (sigma-70 family)